MKTMSKHLSDLIDKIPKELLEGRNKIECNFIFSLYQDIDLFDDYKHIKSQDDIITEDGIFYYDLGLAMVNAGFPELNSMNIQVFLDGKKELKKKYEQLEGYNAIQEIISVVSPDSVEIYYDKLIKSNLLIRLYFKGFNINKNKLSIFEDMTSEEVYDYFEYQLSSVAVDKIDKITIEDLSEGYDKWLDRVLEGKNKGYRIGSGMMNYKLAGIHKGLTLYLGGIGQGKSSSSVPLFILPAIEDGNDICILCNEQTSDEYRSMIIASVLFGKLDNVKGMNRMNITLGNLSESNQNDIRRAAQWLRDRPGKIKFVALNNYDATNVKRIIKKQSKLGCGYFIFDVLKAVNDADENAWAILSDTAKMLSVLALQEDIAIIATAQLASNSMFRPYLDLSSIGKSKAIGECATTIIGFRPIMNTEISKIKALKYRKKEDGTSDEPERIELNPNKHYIMQFIMKNRWGDTQDQIIQEFNQSFNTIRDIGYYKASYDDFNKKGR